MEEFDKKVEALILDHEGMRLKPYRCTAGKLTIGAGRNLEDEGISVEEAMFLLRNDLMGTKDMLARVIPCWHKLSDNRKMVLIDMCYNLGMPRLLKFKMMLAALVTGDYNRAAREMLDSKWAKQVGQRAKTLAAMMREG